MGIFEKKSPEQKQIDLMDKFMRKYQLEDLDQKDLVVLQRIASDLMANGWFKTGMALSFAKAEEQAKVNYLSAQVEQNWMVIRQLGRLNRNIEQMNKNIQTLTEMQMADKLNNRY